MKNQEIHLVVNSEGQFVMTYRDEPWHDSVRDRFTSVMTRNESHSVAMKLLDAQGQGEETSAASILKHAGWLCLAANEAGEKEAAVFLRKKHWSVAPPGRDGTRELLNAFFARIEEMKDEGAEYLKYEMARQGFAITRHVPEDAPAKESP